MNPEAKLVSFVLRFVYDEGTDEPTTSAPGWYSVVRHVQSNTERHLTRWEDIAAFIGQYVDLNKDTAHE